MSPMQRSICHQRDRFQTEAEYGDWLRTLSGKPVRVTFADYVGEGIELIVGEVVTFIEHVDDPHWITHCVIDRNGQLIECMSLDCLELVTSE